MTITIHVAGDEISLEQIEAWEHKRATHVERMLHAKLGLGASPMRNSRTPLSELRASLAQLKVDAGPDTLRLLLRRQTRFSTQVTKAILFLSRRKRRSSVVDVSVPGYTASELKAAYDDLMLHNTTRNQYRGLAANPDHYVLMAHGESVQEVLETTGGSPAASHFFVHYGDEEGLTSTRDPAFPFQAAGVCRLEDGTVIGGVRHQMQDVESGTHVRLEVEFPAALPKTMIAQHRMHLACEFFHWFTDLTADRTAAESI